MILRAGTVTFEFRQTEEMRFSSTEEALNWLKRLGRDSDLISRYRKLLARQIDESEIFRLTDHQVIERLAVMLYLRRIVVTGEEDRAAAGPPTKKITAPPPAFPLSERANRQPSPVSSKSDGADEDTPAPTPVTDLVELTLEWPVHLVERLPDDFKLTLTGPFPAQERAKPAASSDDDLVRFDFEWKDKSTSVQLEASGNGQTVVLWNGQVIGDLEAQIEWEDRLHPLIGDEEDVEIAGEDTGGGSIPNDLKYRERKYLVAELR